MQKYEIIEQGIKEQFLKIKKENPNQLKTPIKLSWSNWGFGREKLEDSLKRLQKVNLDYIELHGNHYGADLGYKANETKKLLSDYNIKCSGICGVFSIDRDMSSNNPIYRQNAIDYLKREIEFAAEVGGEYIIVVPAAVGRTEAYDDTEWNRSVETMQILADTFESHNVKAAIEAIRSAETSMVHTMSEVKRYIAAVDHPGVSHINGDIYHMQSEEVNISAAVIEAGDQLVNLHLADSTRGALGSGSMNIDSVIMAMYNINYNNMQAFATPEPLGPGGNPYPAMNGIPNTEELDKMVFDTINYFREREAFLCK